MKADPITIIVLIVVVVGLAAAAVGQYFGRAHLLLANKAVHEWLHESAAGEWAIEWLRKTQPIQVLLILMPIMYSLKVDLDERYFSEWWFSVSQSFWSTSALVFLFPGVVCLLDGWLVDRRLRKFSSSGRFRYLLILPVILVLVWCPTFQFVTNAGSGSEAAEFAQEGKEGCRAPDGKVLIEAKYDDILCPPSISGPHVPTQLWWHPFLLTWALDLNWNLYEYRVGSLWGVFDRSLRIVSSPRYESVGMSGEGLTPVKLGGKWGYISSRTGKLVIAPEYDGAGSFGYTKGMNGPLAPVKRGDKWGYIDRTNHLRIPFRYDDVQGFTSGVDLDRVDRRIQIYYHTGTWWEEMKADFEEPGAPGWARVRVGEMWGAIDSNGAWLLGPSIPGLDSGAFGKKVGLWCDTARRHSCYFGEWLSAGLALPRQVNRWPITADTAWLCQEAVRTKNTKFPYQFDDGHVWLNDLTCQPKDFVIKENDLAK